MTTLQEIYHRLIGHFGPLTGPAASRPWWPLFSDEPLLEILVGAVLVQQTRWETVEGAVLRLRDAGLLSIMALAEAESAMLAALIRPAAFHTQKAPGLIAIAGYIQTQYGDDMATILARPTAELRRELLSLPRIGPETADVIMLYAGNHQVFVVDAYTRRLFGRVTQNHGSAEGRESHGIESAEDRRRPGNPSWSPATNTIENGAGINWERAPYEAVRQYIEQELLLTPSVDYAEYHAQINEACVRYCLSTPRCDGPPARRVYSRQDGRESYLTSHEGCPLRAICGYYQAQISLTHGVGPQSPPMPDQ
jgi:endonuclease III related protein